MSIAKKDNQISVEQYLKGEHSSEVKHELITGDVYSMAGASANHTIITSNLARKMGNHLEGSPCITFVSDMKLRVDPNFFYPDVMVDCDYDTSEPYFTQSPVIIVEVLSRSTRRTDQTTKRLNYLTIPSLLEYVLIEQDIVDIEVIRKKQGWQSSHYFMGDDIIFESIDLVLSVEEIYHRVQNRDVLDYLSKKELELKK